MVLFQAQQDRATELRIASNDKNGAAMKYKINETWHDFAPPPAHILPGVIEELLRLANIQEAAFPKRGVINQTVHGYLMRWQITMMSPDAECVLTRIEHE
ncbi:MAG TPA: hypothetical protein VG754_11120 [Verrucomicrobiae bacterium]|nr:hypothetical protein [Verrucomicrobiae bacterium]